MLSFYELPKVIIFHLVLFYFTKNSQIVKMFTSYLKNKISQKLIHSLLSKNVKNYSLKISFIILLSSSLFLSYCLFFNRV